MIAVDVATLDDVKALVLLEGKLFREDAGVHDEFADVTWPDREGADDFVRLIADPASRPRSSRRRQRRWPSGWLCGRAFVTPTAGDTCVASFDVRRRGLSTSGCGPADGRDVPVVGTPAGLRRSHRGPLCGEYRCPTFLCPHGIRCPKHLGSTSPLTTALLADVFVSVLTG